MRVGIGTIAAGRTVHVRRQAAAVARSGAARHVVVTMDAEPLEIPGARVVPLPDAAGPGPLPLAAARNRALAELSDCDLAVMLDADCIPGANLLARYAEAARRLRSRPGLLCGPVGYLDPLPEEAAGPSAADRLRARRRVIRDFPVRGLRRERRAELFWSLSFALTPATQAELGGFDEGYRGWGGEDTDLGLRAAEAGIGLWFVGGAWAYHQHHPSTALDDLRALAANARRFHARWGFWPVPDRLAELAATGRIAWAPEGDSCEPAAG